MSVKHIFWQIIAIVFISPVLAENIEESPDEPKTYEFEEIVVTGSRIKSAESLSPAPVVVLSSDEIKARGLTSIGDVLQTLTVQSNATNTQSNNGGDGSTRINLRGLGSNRTLILVNGRRFVPGGTGANSSVDLNSIPTSIIERVEVLKDGASAVYGSDAIGGVVNIITRSEMEGIEIDYYEGISGAGDGEVRDLSITTGLQSQKGHILFSAGYHSRKPVWTGDRSFSLSDKNYDWEKNDGTYNKNGSSATPEGHIIDRLGTEGNEAWQAVIAAAGEDTGDYHRDPNAGWRPFNWAGISSDGSGDTYNYQPENYLYTPQTRYSSFLSGAYKFTKNAQTFFEISYTNRQSDQKLAPTPLFTISDGIVVSATNRYNEFGRDFIDVRRRFLEAGNRNFLQDIDTYRIVLGLNHQLMGFDADLSFSYGRSEGTNVNDGRLIISNLVQALGPDEDCTDDCVQLDILHGAGTITREMLDYIQYTGIARGYSQQQILQWNLTGEIAQLPAGRLVMAAGLSSRWEAGAYLPDPITASGNTTGSDEAPTDGAYSVKALYAEAHLPLYKAGEVGLDLIAAGRTFHYDSFGYGSTYKAGTRLELPQGLAFRATYSNAFRAPSISEMFLGNSDGFPLVSDPCSSVDEAGNARVLTDQQMRNCADQGIPASFEDSRAQLRIQFRGSTDLNPEKATMLTAGLVYQAGFLERFDITVDYYTSAITNEIGALPASLILSNCYSQDTPSNCDQVVRDPNTGLINYISSPNTNVGETETSGLDIGLHYATDSPLGIVSAQIESNLLVNYDQILPTANGPELIKGKGYYDLGVFPGWRHAASVGIESNRSSIGLTWRYIGGFEECEDGDCKGKYRPDVTEVPPSRKVSPNSVFNMHGSYQLETTFGHSVLTIGINNILNQAPAVIYNGFLGTSDANTYDFLGRYLYLRLFQAL